MGKVTVFNVIKYFSTSIKAVRKNSFHNKIVTHDSNDRISDRGYFNQRINPQGKSAMSLQLKTYSYLILPSLRIYFWYFPLTSCNKLLIIILIACDSLLRGVERIRNVIFNHLEE